MTPSPNFLYYIAKVYAIISGQSVSVSEAWLENAVLYTEWFALACSVFFLVSFVYYRLLTSKVEDEMKEKRLAAEMVLLAETQKKAGKNPRWLAVEKLAGGSSESDWRRAILEADSMLHDLLTLRGFAGDDIGEQLRGANKTNFGTLDLAWEAHRLRNKIAHEGETLQLTERDIQATLDQYRRVFEEFEYI